MNFFRKFVGVTVLLLFGCSYSYAQHASLNDKRAFLYEKAFLLRNENVHLGIKPLFFKNYDTVRDSIFADLPPSSSVVFSKDLFSYSDKNSYLSVNPILFSDKRYSTEADTLFMQNGLGFSLKARRNEKFYIDASVYGFSGNYREALRAGIDTLGFMPHYGGDIAGSGDRLFSYETDFRFLYRPEKYISFEAGKSRQFFGNGKHSLFWADNTASMPYASVVVDTWRLKYRWAVMRGRDYNLTEIGNGNGLYEKYFALHYLSVNLTKRINFNFFEAVISNAYDQNGRKGLDVHFLNPVVFYRPIEFAAGTYENALMGVGFDLRLFEKFFLYSQFIIDDMIITELKAGSGWWGNKFGLQAGFKGYDFMSVENLYVLGEINIVRPFTYSHQRDNINYGNYYLPAAHPAGANFADLNFDIKYARNRILAALELQVLVAGKDSSDISYGSDIYKSYEQRNDNYDIRFLQGERLERISVNAYASFLINPRMNLSLEAGIKWEQSQLLADKKSNGMIYLQLNAAAFYNVLDR